MCVTSESSNDIIAGRPEDPLKDCIEELLTAHAALEQAQVVVSACQQVKKFDALKGATPQALQFFSILKSNHSTNSDLAQTYQEFCEERVIECLAVRQRHLRALHDANGTRTDIVRRLPKELVGHIFMFLVEENDPFSFQGVCHVSSAWRAIALATPTLWALYPLSINVCMSWKNWKIHEKEAPKFDLSLVGDERPSLKCPPVASSAWNCRRDIRRPDPVNAWLARSGALPFHVHLRWKPDNESYSAWMLMFSALADRLETLVFQNAQYVDSAKLFYVGHQGLGSCDPLAPRSFARLRVLEFQCPFLSARHIRLQMPNLQSISYSQDNLTNGAPFEWSTMPNITSIITNEYGFMSLMLDAKNGEGRLASLANNLCSLSLHIRASSAGFGHFADETRTLERDFVKFPSLRDLRILDATVAGLDVNQDTASFFRAASIPELRTLTWSNMSYHQIGRDDGRHLIAILGTHLSPRCPALTALEIDTICLDIRSCKTVLRAIPNLTILRLRRLSTREILLALSREDHEESDDQQRCSLGTVLLPKLRDLKLEELVDGEIYVYAVIRYRGLISTKSEEYPPRLDGRCVALESVNTNGIQW